MAIYKLVKEDIRKKIDESVYCSGEKIPSERVLSAQYGISRMTLRQALKELEKEGYVSIEKGRGTFVAPPELFQEDLRSFTATLIARNMVPSTRIIEVSKVKHIRDISEKLDISSTEPYFKIKRLRLGNQIPMALETVYIPMIYAEGIDQFDLTKSLYQLLEEHYGYEIIRSACEIEACLANRVISEQIGAKKNAALLKVCGVTYCQDEMKLFYEASYYRSTLYKYHVDIMGQRKE